MRMQPDRNSYFQRFGFCERQIATPPPSNLGLVVVIPCFNEPDLIGSLESLRNCDRPACAVEVIVVLNSSAKSSETARLQNQQTLQEVRPWMAVHSDPRLAFHLLHFPNLPPKQAGVGLARKIGMDEAARRFDDTGNGEGVMVGFDADCRCERNYLSCIERHFGGHPSSPGCSIYFEHPLDTSPEIAEAIVAYELHLRYYVQALRFAGFPCAHHTIGSSMAVRAEIYQKQGGMNKRQAGEDFYFLHKITPLGGFTDLTETTVFPSPRPSDRVPFGTGKAVRGCLRGERILTYPLTAFLDLKQFFQHLPNLYRVRDNFGGELPLTFPEAIRGFFKPEAFASAVKEISQNTSSELAFRKRFFHWFDAFQTMKFLHYARDHFYGAKDVAEESRQLLRLKFGALVEAPMWELLRIYRDLDRKA